MAAAGYTHLRTACMLGLVVLIASAPTTTRGAKMSWRCQVCQDSVKAVRAIVEDLVAPTSSNSEKSDAASLLPQYGCSQFQGPMRQLCQAMRQNFIDDSSRALQLQQAVLDNGVFPENEAPHAETNLKEDRLSEIVSGISARHPARAYHICHKAGECAERPHTDCAKQLMAPSCSRPGNCGRASAECSPRCQVCAWLVRTWPKFMPDTLCGDQVALQVETQGGQGGGGGDERKGLGFVQEQAASGSGSGGESESGGGSSADGPKGTGAQGGGKGTTGGKGAQGGGKGTTGGKGAQGGGAAADPASSQKAYDDWSTSAVREAGMGSPPLATRDFSITGLGGKSQSPGAGKLAQHCHHMAWASMDLPSASGMVLGQSASLGPWPWSSGMVCACMGRCAYDSMDGLAVEEACPSALATLGRQLQKIREPDSAVRGMEPEGGQFVKAFNKEGREIPWRQGMYVYPEMAYFDELSPIQQEDLVDLNVSIVFDSTLKHEDVCRRLEWIQYMASISVDCADEPETKTLEAILQRLAEQTSTTTRIELSEAAIRLLSTKKAMRTFASVLRKNPVLDMLCLPSGPPDGSEWDVDEHLLEAVGACTQLRQVRVYDVCSLNPYQETISRTLGSVEFVGSLHVTGRRAGAFAARVLQWSGSLESIFVSHGQEPRSIQNDKIFWSAVPRCLTLKRIRCSPPLSASSAVEEMLSSALRQHAGVEELLLDDDQQGAAKQSVQCFQAITKGLAMNPCSSLRVLRVSAESVASGDEEYLRLLLQQDLHCLRVLDLHNVQMDGFNMVPLFEGLQAPRCQLETLRLCRVKISRPSAAALQDALRINRKLKKLAIVECDVDGDSVDQICAGMTENLGLEQLICVGTGSRGWGGRLGPALRKNDTLRRLVLPGFIKAASYADSLRDILVENMGLEQIEGEAFEAYQDDSVQYLRHRPGLRYVSMSGDDGFSLDPGDWTRAHTAISGLQCLQIAKLWATRPDDTDWYQAEQEPWRSEDEDADPVIKNTAPGLTIRFMDIENKELEYIGEVSHPRAKVVATARKWLAQHPRPERAASLLRLLANEKAAELDAA